MGAEAVPVKTRGDASPPSFATKGNMDAAIWISMKVKVSGYRDRKTGEIVVTSATLDGGKEFRGKELELGEEQLDDVRRELADAIQGDI